MSFPDFLNCPSEHFAVYYFQFLFRNPANLQTALIGGIEEGRPLFEAMHKILIDNQQVRKGEDKKSSLLYYLYPVSPYLCTPLKKLPG